MTKWKKLVLEDKQKQLEALKVLSEHDQSKVRKPAKTHPWVRRRVRECRNKELRKEQYANKAKGYKS